MIGLKVGQQCWFEQTLEEGTIISVDGDEFKVYWDRGGITTERLDDCNEIIFEYPYSDSGSNQVKDYITAIEKKYTKDNPIEVIAVDEKQYKHYFKDVSNLESIDIYRTLVLWEVTHPCLQHAAKKILVAGNRGHKDIQKDIQEAIDSLIRWQEMRSEDEGFTDKQEEDNNKETQ